jgi:vitamin B12 transporter
LLRAAPAFAVDDAPGDAGMHGDVVVTATRTPTDESQLAVPVIVITRAEIERALAGDVAGLLASEPGVEVARSGGPGQPASLFLRGSNSNHAVVLVDGVRVNPGTFGGAALQNIQPESIERIEIVEGARSSLYGSDAIGGVVNLITRAGSTRGLSAMASIGRYGEHTLAADGGTELGPLQLGGSVARQSATGFPPRLGDPAPGNYDNWSGNLHARAALGEGLAAEASAWRTTGHSAYSEFGTAASEDFADASYAASLLVGDAQGAHGRIGVSRAQAEYRQLQSPDFDHTQRDVLDGQLTVPHGAHTLTGGFNLGSEHARTLSFGLPYDVTTRSQFAFAQDQWHGSRDDLLLAIGHTHHDSFGSHVTGNVEVVRLLCELAGGSVRASAAWGSAFHAPDATALYGYDGNSALQPEISHQGQLGLRWVGAGLQLRAEAFENRLANLIQYVPIDPAQCLIDPYCVYQAQNVARARIRGLTLRADAQAGTWSAGAWATLQDPRDLTGATLLLKRARRSGGAKLAWEQGRGWAAVEAQYTGPRNDYGDVPMGGYALLALGAGWRFDQALSVQMRLDNALDRSYELASGYRTPGRSLSLALRWHLR